MLFNLSLCILYIIRPKLKKKINEKYKKGVCVKKMCEKGYIYDTGGLCAHLNVCTIFNVRSVGYMFLYRGCNVCVFEFNIRLNIIFRHQIIFLTFYEKNIL